MEAPMKKPVVISVVNHKGGCLKTTLTVNLAAGLAREGKKVLAIDLDAQQNLTASLIGPISSEEAKRTLFDALVDETGLDHLIVETGTENLDLVPVTEEFAGADLSLVSAVGRETIFKSCLEQTTRLQDYDFVLLDNPPSISLVVMNSLVASDFFLVPCSADYLPMVGLSLLGDSISKIRRLAPYLQSLGVVLTLYSRNERICRQVENMLKNRLKGNLFETKIRVNTKAKAAPSVKKTIFDYEKSSTGRGTQDFTALAKELLARLEAREVELRSVAHG
jgi:chromosome partitioning protein